MPSLFQKPHAQLLKWAGNKYRVVEALVEHFPHDIIDFYDPFMKSGEMVASFSGFYAYGSELLPPLVSLLEKVKTDPSEVHYWYTERWLEYERSKTEEEKDQYFLRLRESYNKNPNPADFVFLTRVVYGGVFRIRSKDGCLTTVRGTHKLVHPHNFHDRVQDWNYHLQNCQFLSQPYWETMRMAKEGDLIYCDPPYHPREHSFYGPGRFDLVPFFKEIQSCKDRGVRVAVSLDLSKHSGEVFLSVEIPEGLFVKEVPIRMGKSTLQRLKLRDKKQRRAKVVDRLLLTY